MVAEWPWIPTRGYTNKRSPARLTLIITGFATLMMGLALLWPNFEPTAHGLVRGWAPREHSRNADPASEGAERLARDIANTEKEIAYYLDRLDTIDDGFVANRMATYLWHEGLLDF